MLGNARKIYFEIISEILKGWGIFKFCFPQFVHLSHFCGDRKRWKLILSLDLMFVKESTHFDVMVWKVEEYIC